MKVLLYTIDEANGRCALLCKKIHEATGMSDTDSIRLGKQLFAGYYPRDNPLAVDVRDWRSADELRALCAEFGITVDHQVEGDGC